MLFCRWFFGLISLVVSAIATGRRSMDRHVQWNVNNHMHGASNNVSLDDKAQIAAKIYLTRLRDRYADVLDRPWDTKYNNHRNMKKWVY